MKGRTIAISGAGRGLGAALSLVLADLGALPLLLGRNPENLAEVADQIAERGGRVAGMVPCDLTSVASCTAAGETIVSHHADCDAIIHNGALWDGERLENQDGQRIFDLVNSAATGAMVLTHHLVLHFRKKTAADILVVGSATGYSHALLRGSSIVFKAAKAAQEAFAQGLAEELRESPIRVSAIHPGFFRDIMPDEPEWNAERRFDDPMTDREVTDAILFMLTLPRNVAVRSLFLERNTDFQLWPNDGDDSISVD